MLFVNIFDTIQKVFNFVFFNILGFLEADDRGFEVKLAVRWIVGGHRDSRH